MAYVKLILFVIPLAIVVNVLLDWLGLEHYVFRPVTAGAIIGGFSLLIGRRLGIIPKLSDD